MKKIIIVVILVLIVLAVLGIAKKKNTNFDNEISNPKTEAKNQKIESIKLILNEGVRPRFAPDGQSFLFDKKNSDGYYDVYISDLAGNITANVTENKNGIKQRNNGNATFDKSGKYIVFISEEDDHFLDNQKYLADPGVGVFSNLYATDINQNKFWQLTNIPIKKSLTDKIPATATVNPHFSEDGKLLIWTERYAEGGNLNWGKWRIKAGDFVIENNQPKLMNERVVFTPTKGNYVTFMGQLDATHWIVSGNLDGQHEYGMDQYVLNVNNKQLTNLTNTPEYWEEDSSVMPDGRIVYISNIDSKLKFDFNKNWVSQPMERDYYIMNADGSAKERLTYFNEKGAPEYAKERIMTVASDISPDGKYMAATLGYDYDDKTRNVVLKIALIKFK